MIGGKYQDITLDDIISFASEIGIRAPKSIIRKVASAVSSFRSLAEKNEVKEEWTGRVESTIINHLKAWGEWQEEINTPELVINGHSVSNIRIEQALKAISISLQPSTVKSASMSLTKTEKHFP